MELYSRLLYPYIKATMSEILKTALPALATSYHRSVYTIEDLLKLKPPEWLIEGVIEQNSLAMLYGPPGSGKSFVALDIALCIAYGKPWAGHNVTSGSVIYVAAEGYQSLKRRLEAWMTYYGVTPSRDIIFMIEPVDLTGGSKSFEHFMLEGVGGIVGGEEVFEYFEGELVPVDMKDAPPVRLVVFDTLARCIVGADENDAKDMGRVIQWVDKLRDKYEVHIEPAVLLIHHNSKNSHLERGSTVLRGATDTMMHLSKDAEGLVIRCTKQKNDEEFKPVAMNIKVMTERGALVIPRPKTGTPGGLPLAPLSTVQVAYKKRTLDVLKAIALTTDAAGSRLMDIATETGLAPATAYRIRIALEEDGMVSFDTNTKRVMATMLGVKQLIERGLLPASVLDTTE